jgi:hypothetical protein
METLSLNSTFTYGEVKTGTASRQTTGTFDTTIYKPLIREYYYSYYPYWQNEDKISKAFKLAQKLIEKKFIKEPLKVKDFIELINELAEII